jgi:hypothetical protein
MYKLGCRVHIPASACHWKLWYGQNSAGIMAQGSYKEILSHFWSNFEHYPALIALALIVFLKLGVTVDHCASAHFVCMKSTSNMIWTVITIQQLLGLVEPRLHTSNELLCICFVQSTTFCNFLLFGYKPTGKILIFQH